MNFIKNKMVPGKYPFYKFAFTACLLTGSGLGFAVGFKTGIENYPPVKTGWENVIKRNSQRLFCGAMGGVIGAVILPIAIATCPITVPILVFDELNRKN